MKVSRDDYSQHMEKMFQTTNQIGYLLAIDIGFAFLSYVL